MATEPQDHPKPAVPCERRSHLRPPDPLAKSAQLFTCLRAYKAQPAQSMNHEL